MVSGKHMKPAFEVLYLVQLELRYQFFKNLHNGVLALLFVFKIIEANPKNQVHILVVERTQCLQIATFLIGCNQFRIVVLINLGGIFDKLQCGPLLNLIQV